MDNSTNCQQRLKDAHIPVRVGTGTVIWTIQNQFPECDLEKRWKFTCECTVLRPCTLMIFGIKTS